jgi:hypothetical protein
VTARLTYPCRSGERQHASVGEAVAALRAEAVLPSETREVTLRALAG